MEALPGGRHGFTITSTKHMGAVISYIQIGALERHLPSPGEEFAGSGDRAAKQRNRHDEEALFADGTRVHGGKSEGPADPG